MTNTTELTLVADLSAELLTLMQARALSESEGERMALTVLVHGALLRMGQPVPVGENAPPWTLIVQVLLGEITAGRFSEPYKFDEEGGVSVLCVRPGHVMEFLRFDPRLRAFWETLPDANKSDRRLKRDLVHGGVVLMDGPDPLVIERTVKDRRVGHMVALSLPALKQRGLWSGAV